MQSSRQLPPYQYRCEDRSWLTAWLGRTIVPWIEKRIPVRMPANHVTLASSLCLLGSTWLIGNSPAEFGAILAGVALLVAYTLFDMVDGQHARRLGTSSPLGEYLDHTLDVLNAALVLFAIFRVRPEWTPGGFVVALAVVNVVFLSTLLEQKMTGTMKLGAIGPVEGLLLSTGYLATWMLPGAATWWNHPAIPGVSRVDLFIGGGLCFALSGAYAAVRRLGRVPAGLVVFVAAEILMLGAWFAGAPSRLVIAVLALLALDYGGRVIASHLLATPKPPFPDGVAPSLMIIAVLLPDRFQGVAAWIGWMPAVWLLGRVVLHTVRVLMLYRGFWVWWHAAAKRPAGGA